MVERLWGRSDLHALVAQFIKALAELWLSSLRSTIIVKEVKAEQNEIHSKFVLIPKDLNLQ